MYSIVPQNEYALLSWSMASLLNPKSETERDRKKGEQGKREDGHKDRIKDCLQLDTLTSYFDVSFFIQKNTVEKKSHYILKLF